MLVIMHIMRNAKKCCMKCDFIELNACSQSSLSHPLAKTMAEIAGCHGTLALDSMLWGFLKIVVSIRNLPDVLVNFPNICHTF